jgi:hypothetical protein
MFELRAFTRNGLLSLSLLTGACGQRQSFTPLHVGEVVKKSPTLAILPLGETASVAVEVVDGKTTILLSDPTRELLNSGKTIRFRAEEGWEASGFRAVTLSDVLIPQERVVLKGKSDFVRVEVHEKSGTYEKAVPVIW